MKKTTISGEKINEQLELINSKKWPGWLPTFHNTTIYEIDLLKNL